MYGWRVCQMRKWKSRNITRHIVARLSAQVYDRLGRALGIMMVSIKILLSRTCEVVPGIGMMNTELYALDQELVELIVKLLKNIRNVSSIRPFPRHLIPSGNSLSAIVSFCYGGILALGSCVYYVIQKGMKNKYNTSWGKLQRVVLHLKFSLVIWNSKIKISKILNSLNWVEFPNSEFQNLNQNSKSQNS